MEISYSRLGCFSASRITRPNTPPVGLPESLYRSGISRSRAYDHASIGFTLPDRPETPRLAALVWGSTYGAGPLE